MHGKHMVLAVALAAFAPGLAFTQAARPQVARTRAERFVVMSGGQSSARFTTDAPLETIVGNTSAVSGEVTFDKSNPGATRGRIEVDVSTLRTGIDMRDEHLRGAQWLNTTEHPRAVFEMTGATFQGPVADNQQIRGTVQGRLTIHGVTKEVTAELTGTYVPLTPQIRNEQFGFTGNILRIRATFRTHFTDHGMQVPQMLFMKVSNDIDVEVNLTLVAQAPAPAKRPSR